jgi:apolipoprotein N-acyltransferase
MILKKFKADLLSLFSGAALVLAFAPFNLYILGIIAPGVLLWNWRDTSPKQAFWQGFLFGLGLFTAGVSWVYVSMHSFGQASSLVAILLTAALIIFLSLFPAMQGWFLSTFFKTDDLKKWLLVFPSSWVIFEWIREWFLTGFPWLLLGYTQTQSVLRGYAPIIGVYGLSFLTALSSALFLALLLLKKPKPRLFLGLAIIVIWGLGALLTLIHWTKPSEKPLRVSLVQGNIEQQLKWQAQQADTILNQYVNLSSKHWDSQLIVWPEAAITLWQNQASDFLNWLDHLAKFHHTSILTGIPIAHEHKAFNGLLLIGDSEGEYLKRHLVPFGEFMPLKSLLLWLRNYVEIPMSDFDRGPQNQIELKLNQYYFSSFICYEIIYPEEVWRAFPQSNFIVVISDDSWFGKSLAPPQHLQMAQMRALETGRPLLMATNNGITAIVNEQGYIVDQAPAFTATVLSGKIYPMTGRTPLIAGVRFIIIPLMFVLLLLAALITRRKKLA